MQALYTALAAFQQEVPPIYKGTSGYGYKYAELSEILAVINPLLQKHKLGFTQLLDGTSLKTVIFQTDSGETIESTMAIPQGVQLKGMNDFQVLGSAITYLRRYSLSAALGLVTDRDTDAHGEQKAPRKPAAAIDPAVLTLIRTTAKDKGIDEATTEARIKSFKTTEDAQHAYQNLLLLGRD